MMSEPRKKPKVNNAAWYKQDTKALITPTPRTGDSFVLLYSDSDNRTVMFSHRIKGRALGKHRWHHCRETFCSGIQSRMSNGKALFLMLSFTSAAGDPHVTAIARARYRMHRREAKLEMWPHRLECLESVVHGNKQTSVLRIKLDRRWSRSIPMLSLFLGQYRAALKNSRLSGVARFNRLLEEEAPEQVFPMDKAKNWKASNPRAGALWFEKHLPAKAKPHKPANK